MRILAAVLWLVTVASGCVESACYSHAECPDGKVCFSDGKCRVPDCTATTECGLKQVCEGFRCVAGCSGPEECDAGFTCSSNRCVPVDDACQCPSAPDFCLIDVNPGSPTHSQDICLKDQKGTSVLLLFGSIACSHCHALYSRLLELRETLVGEGLSPTLLFVNLKSVPLDSGAISSQMPQAVLPLVQDTPTEDVWGEYGATWYEVVLIDRNGCLMWHSGDLLSTGGLEGQAGEAFLQLWRSAEAAQCVTIQDVVPQADVMSDVEELRWDSPETSVQPDGVDADLEDAHDWSDPPDAHDAQDFYLPDTSDAADTKDTGEEAYAEVVFELDQYCQIQTVPPIKVGDKVPPFLCMNRSLSSGGIGEAVSDLTLNGMVWVAYAGACT